MSTFNNCYFEIVGFCNAKCPYCSTGSKNRLSQNSRKSRLSQNSRKNRFIPTDLFKVSVQKLLEKGIINRHTPLSLYNWGEPLLHPDLQEIVEFLNHCNLFYGLSTNASKEIKMNKSFIQNLGCIKFSMSGFSQKSYDRIHGFDFAKIKENITHITEDLRQAGFQREIVIDYHIYQFNVQEIIDCKNFADKIGVSFFPYFAHFNDWWQMQGWLKNTLSKEKLHAASEDLFCFYIKENMEKSPPNYRCPQFDTLVIDEQANVLTCCCLPEDHPHYSLGNIITDDMETILDKKERQAVCTQCRGIGLAYHFNNPIIPRVLIR